jgi:antitoxin ChpS
VHKANLRQVGGSVILALPPAFLKQLGVGAGSEVGLILENDRLIVQPQRSSRRYTLDELLSQCDASVQPSEEDREWLQSQPVRNELL